MDRADVNYVRSSNGIGLVLKHLDEFLFIFTSVYFSPSGAIWNNFDQSMSD
jgi:hypothetical protein